MLFYFVRHGETIANRQQVMAGSGLDFALTEVGHQQAEGLARDIQKRIGHKVHRVVASNLMRAHQTAQYLGAALALPVETEVDLREWHLGEWEGQPYAQYLPALVGDGEPTDGESRAEFYARVEAGWRRVHHDTQPYLIVSHGAVWLALQDILKIPRFKVENCQLLRVSCQHEVWRAEALST